MKISAIIALFLFLAIAQAIPPAAVRTSWTTNELIRIRCSQNPDEETYFFFNGTVTAYLDNGATGPSIPINGPAASIRPLFNAVGINVAKCYKSNATDPVWYLVGREALWYLSYSSTGAEPMIINTWTNLNGEAVNVMHVDNDPVMQTFTTRNPITQGGQPTTFPGMVYGDDAILPSDVTFPLNYPSPLNDQTNNPNSDFNQKFAPYAPSKYYQAAELFNFISSNNDVKSTKDAVDSTVVTWTRTGQFLPWMKMANKQGYLVYSFRGAKIPDYTYLPFHIKADIENRVPHYKHAPQSKCFPDMRGTVHSQTGGVTSWTLFREQFEAGTFSTAQYPLSTPRSYGCRPEAQYVPAEETRCKGAASLTWNNGNGWTIDGKTVFQYDITSTNVGTNTVKEVFITLENVDRVIGSWNIERQGTSNVWKIQLWNNLASGASQSGNGIQVTTTTGTGAVISKVAVTCV